MKRRVEKPCACYLCGRNGSADPLDKHHVFGGAYRKKSEHYGAVVYLCHDRCHIFGPEAVHRNAEVMQRVRSEVQKNLMEYYGWTEDDFRKEFGASYLQEDLEEKEEMTGERFGPFYVI